MNNEARTRATAHYHKQRGTQVHLWFHDVNDADILKRLNEVGNKQGYIKALIRDDIAEGEYLKAFHDERAEHEAKRKAADGDQ